jgi:hypothetical protein
MSDINSNLHFNSQGQEEKELQVKQRRMIKWIK